MYRKCILSLFTLSLFTQDGADAAGIFSESMKDAPVPGCALHSVEIHRLQVGRLGTRFLRKGAKAQRRNVERGCRFAGGSWSPVRGERELPVVSTTIIVQCEKWLSPAARLVAASSYVAPSRRCAFSQKSSPAGRREKSRDARCRTARRPGHRLRCFENDRGCGEPTSDSRDSKFGRLRTSFEEARISSGFQ